MTREEIAMGVFKEIRPKLLARWAEETVTGPLDAEGDAQRRIAATKVQAFDDVMIQLERAIKGL